MSIADCIPYYPDIDDPMFESEIYAKQEFRGVASRARGILPQQLFVARYLSTYTLYDGLLVFHEPGTGKTCTAVATIESMLAAPGTPVKHALILTRGQGLIDNFVQEIINVCAADKYSTIAQSKRVRSRLYPRYEFDTYEVFVKKIQQQQLVAHYNNYVIVLDEVHNTITESKEEYTVLHSFLHRVQGCKILAMSGTPMRDAASEIADVMNLILPLDRQMPTAREFDALFFADQKLVNAATLQEHLRGRVSYLRTQVSDVQREFVGEKLGSLRQLAVFRVDMGAPQAQAYAAASRTDTDLYSAARQAALFVFPDGTYGASGFAKHIRRIERKSKSGIKNTYIVTRPGLMADVLANIDSLSAKYAAVVRALQEHPRDLAFVYCEYVEGSGLVVLSKILEALGYVRASGKETTPGRRYGIVTNMTSTVKHTRSLLALFNAPRNRYGEYVAVILGSRMISEGFTIKNVRQTHILTPHWNYGETDQAIARTFRTFSHDALIADGVVPVLRVYQYVVFAGSEPSIDLQMYQIAENKDLRIKQVERAIKQSAVDCEIFREKNTLPPSSNYTRACEYTTCAYSCGIDTLPVDPTTYHLLYHADEAAEILAGLERAAPLEPFVVSPDHGALAVADTLRAVGTRQRDGRTGYTHIDRSAIYTSLAPFEAPDRGNMYYYTHPVHTVRSDFYALAEKYMFRRRIPPLIAELCSSTTADQIGAVFAELPLRVQEIVLQHAAGTDTPLAQRIVAQYRQYIHVLPSGDEVIALAAAKTGTVLCRARGETEWRTCPASVVESVSNQETDVAERALELGRYGVVANNKFLIKALSEPTADKRKMARGRVCTTIDRSDLDALAARLGVATQPSDSKRQLCTALKAKFDEMNLVVYL